MPGINEFPKTIFSKQLSAFLKGCAILLVLISHLGGAFTRVFTPLGGIGVAIFLFFSGYGLTASFYKSGLSKFWYKRLLSVFIPYFIL